MQLSELRQHITSIDSELLRLLDERMQLAEWVAAYKREHGLPVFDAVREAEILAKIPEGYRDIWKEIMGASKKVQEDYLKKA